MWTVSKKNSMDLNGLRTQMLNILEIFNIIQVLQARQLKFL